MPRFYLKIQIRERDRIVREDKVRAVSSVNDRGVFDVLPMHVNFVSLIRDLVVLHKDSGEERIKIDSALMHVFQDRVTIYLGLRNRRLPPRERNQF